jgi:O-succinylbenzoate synthase
LAQHLLILTIKNIEHQELSVLISAYSLHKYRIPLSPSLAVARQRIAVREGLILSFTLDTQQSAMVEIAPLSGLDETGAPLTGFSRESLALVEQALLSLLPSLIGKSIHALKQVAQTIQGMPSLAFGLSLAHIKLNQKLGQKTDRKLSYLESQTSVSNNHGTHSLSQKTVALLCPSLPLDNPQAYITQKLDGTNTHQHFIKIKVGQHSVEDEMRLIYQVLALYPRLKLRLDANRAFNLEQAIDFLACLPKDAIDFIEEPCQDPEDNPKMYQSLGITYALDETLNDGNYRFKAMQGLKALILKPMLLGSLEGLQALITEANQHGVRCLISSSLESDLGLDDLAPIAAWLTPDESPGLDTLSSFTDTVLLKGAGSKGTSSLKDTLLTEQDELNTSVLTQISASNIQASTVIALL